MTQAARAAFALTLLLLPTGLLMGQADTNGTPPPEEAPAENAVRSGDDLGGIHYFLKIVETDTLTADNMPIVGFEGFALASVQPVPKKQVAPIYPKEARDSSLTGIVWLKCLIGTDGLVKKTKVMKADAAVFVDAAVAAAKQWMFIPAYLNGQAIEVWAAIPFRFGADR